MNCCFWAGEIRRDCVCMRTNLPDRAKSWNGRFCFFSIISCCMRLRRETPHRLESDLNADEFRQGVKYTCWRPRGSGDWLLIYTVGGSGRITTPGGSFATRPGEAILYAPGD